MMDLVVPVLERVMSVYLAGQIYTIASFVLILSGTLALNRQLYGHWSVLPMIAFPLLYNNIFLIGTMNYVFGIGIALWALAAWIWLRERGLLVRLGVSALFVLGLFFCHLFAVGLYGLGVLAFELLRLWEQYARPQSLQRRDLDGEGTLPPLVDFVVSGLPFLPVLPFGVLNRKPIVFRVSPIEVLLPDGVNPIKVLIRVSTARPVSVNRLTVASCPLSVRT